MTFKIKEESFVLDNKKIFLNSGEIHYFRIKKELWEKHLLAAKDAGLSTVSTYVPWAWHEPEENKFDFNGISCPERDLESWVNLCSSLGLYCILKPGPFILAEYRGAGLPDWFLNKYGDTIRMHNSKGEKVNSDGVSLFHPSYMQKVEAWYNKIMPFIKSHQISNGGPVIMMQVCNEIGVFSWLAHQADYNERVKSYFTGYLSEKYGDIEIINNLWGKNFPDFDSIDLPPDGQTPYANRIDRGIDHEWHNFWRKYYGDYLRMLTNMIRELGINVPLYHNLPGWIYGNGFEFPVNITMYEDLFRDKSEIIFGVDHIPEFVSYRNLHDDRIINDITHAMQGNKPLFAAEFQCGSREYHVVTNPRELELFYKASIANGLKGWNYYMFSQGRNPDRKGYSGSKFYWFNPLTPEGEKTEIYPLVSKMSKIIKTSEEIILNSERKAQICVAFYPPYYATELERPTDPDCKLNFNFSSIRRQAYFDGLLKALQVLNIDYDMADLYNSDLTELSMYKQVWAFATDEMDAKDQEKLMKYAGHGGNLIIFPNLPDHEMSGKPCTLIREALNIEPEAAVFIDSPLIDILGYKDIKCANPQMVYNENHLVGPEIIARNLNSEVCGFSKSYGKGIITHIGTWLGFDTEGHLPVYEVLTKLSGAKIRNANSDNEFIIVRERFSSEGTGVLFIGNYCNQEHSGKINYTHPYSGEIIQIPYLGGSVIMPALYGILTPLNMKITNDLAILHTTSNILEIDKNDRQIDITLSGDRDLNGEMVIEFNDKSKNISILFDDKMSGFVKNENRIIINYRHKHNSTSVIKILLNENKK